MVADYPGFGYNKHRLPSGGAKQWTPSRNYIAKSSILGFGVEVMKMLSPVQPPQVFNPLHIGQLGFGGIMAGNLISQPLISNTGLPYTG